MTTPLIIPIELQLTLRAPEVMASVERALAPRFLAQQSAPSPATGIDPRTLLLSGQSDPTIAPPARVQAAIDRRAWQLAGEAHALLREHLQRRVAFASEVGRPAASTKSGRCRPSPGAAWAMRWRMNTWPASTACAARLTSFCEWPRASSASLMRLQAMARNPHQALPIP